MSKKAEAKDILRRFNIWRRYYGPHDTTPTCPDPAEIGIAIDTLVNDELTWKDVQQIVNIADALLSEWLDKHQGKEFKTDEDLLKAYYEDVLERFNDNKK